MRALTLALLAVFLAAPARAETVAYLDGLLNTRAIGGALGVEPGVYVGLSVIGQYNPLLLIPDDPSAAPVFDGITLTDTPVMLWAFDTIEGEITLTDQSTAVFELCTFIGPVDVIAGPGSGVELVRDTYLPAPAPEPAVWAIMLAGLGLTGATMRRRKTWPAC